MVYEKIKKLAIAKGVSIYRVERDAGLSNGAISKWGKLLIRLHHLRV